MNDLRSHDDVKMVVDLQYKQLLENEQTRKHFEHLNLEEHLPRIYNFWCFILDVDAADHVYKGSAFEPHSKLGLENVDFEIWQHCLKHAVNSQFVGEKSSLMIDKAKQLGMMFQYKMGLLDLNS